MDPLVQALVTYGPLGIGCVALGFAVMRLYNRNNELQDKRIDEMRQTNTIVQANTVSQDNTTKAMQALGDLIRAQKGGGA